MELIILIGAVILFIIGLLLKLGLIAGFVIMGLVVGGATGIILMIVSVLIILLLFVIYGTRLLEDIGLSENYTNCEKEEKIN